MKNNIYFCINFFVTLQWFFAPSLCLAMEQKSQQHNTYVISNIINPTSVAWCGTILFVGGPQGLWTYDHSNKQQCLLDDSEVYHIIAHPLTTDVAVSSLNKLAVYNGTTEIIKWTDQSLSRYSSIAFSPTDATLFIYDNRRGSLWTCYYPSNSTTKSQQVSQLMNLSLNSRISSHPIEKKVLYPNGGNTMYVSKPEAIWATWRCEESITSQENDHICYAQFNSSGTCIAIDDDYGQYCIFEHKKYSLHRLQSTNDTLYAAKAFHSHRNIHILAVLTHKESIEYWNYQTKKLIATTYDHAHHVVKPTQDKIIFDLLGTQRLNFSPDGKYLAAALRKNCYLLPVPYNNLLAVYQVLTTNNVPKELTREIFQFLPHCSGLSYLNFLELLKIDSVGRC